MRALVSGSAGFIGSHLVDGLLARGYRVTGIDRQWRPAHGGYEHLHLDLADESEDRRLLETAATADVVFHLAGRPGVRDGGPAIEAMRWKDNVIATRNLIAAVPADTPLVVASSSSVYGDATDGASSEDQELRPRGGYARSKVAMEQVCEMRRRIGGIVAIVRPFTVAGEGQRPDMAFSSWLDALRRDEPIRIFGPETRSRDITDVRDAVEGLIRAGERKLGATVNLGTGVGHRLIDMARTLVEVSGLDGEVVHLPVVADEVDATLADTTRCRSLLGFVPSTDLPRLIARQVAASESTSMLVAT